MFNAVHNIKNSLWIVLCRLMGSKQHCLTFQSRVDMINILVAEQTKAPSLEKQAAPNDCANFPFSATTTFRLVGVLLGRVLSIVLYFDWSDDWRHRIGFTAPEGYAIFDCCKYLLLTERNPLNRNEKLTSQFVSARLCLHRSK